MSIFNVAVPSICLDIKLDLKPNYKINVKQYPSTQTLAKSIGKKIIHINVKVAIKILMF